MQTIEMIIDEDRRRESGLLNALIDAMAWPLIKLFGCWHGRVSRPFYLNDERCYACLSCGARLHSRPNGRRG